MQFRLFLTTLLLMAAMGMSAQSSSVLTDDYKKDVREKLALDYSMPDYSTSKIDAKVIGPRMAAILKKIQELKETDTSMGTLSVMQANQIDGMIFCRVKKVNLHNVQKRGNKITVTYDTELAENVKNLKTSQLVFHFVDGVSEDSAVNEFFSQISRCMKE